MAKNDSAKDTGAKAGAKGAKAFRLLAASKKPIQVKHLDTPLKYVRRDRIHPRRVLPRVKEGRKREFPSLTREVAYHLQWAAPGLGLRATTDDLTLVINTELAQPGQKQLASSVDEPSVAAAKNNNGDVVMYTGNWYAARSADGGQTFQYIDPFTSFPDPTNLSFCCDQVVNYIPSIDTFVWLLQYGPKTGPQADNIQRLAFAKTADVVAGRWSLFDITTDSLGVTGQFMDFPDLAVGANSLYVTTNLFTPDGQGSGGAVVRIPIASIDSGSVTAQSFLSPDPSLNSFRVAQNSGTTAFFAAHTDTSTLRVWAWDESQGAPTPSDVGIAPWIGGQGYQSVTPDGQRWLDRIDPRITGAAMAGSELWFAWSVDSGSNNRPNAFVQIARIDATNLTLIENINVFDLNAAIAYGALSSNIDNEVGISYMIGGAQQFPSHLVGILTGTRKDMLVSAGERGTLDSQWGDYLTVRLIFPDRKLFAATGYTMKGQGDGSNRDATPRYVVFGRSSGTSGIGPVPTPVTPVPTPPIPPVTPIPPTPVTDGGPITDVNSLPVVSAAVAAQIKAAAGLGGAAPQALPRAAAAALAQADSPGSERWPVKTGQDPDRAKVGKNVINGNDLGAGIVETTIEELTALPRPAGLTDPTKDPPQFKDVRANVTEVTIWRIEATIIGLKHEHDGDYHLVLQSNNTTAEMVAEIPTPTNAFIGDSPWLANISDARQEVDNKLVKHLAASAFSLMNGKYVPHGAVTAAFKTQQTAPPGLRFETPPPGSTAVQPLFDVAITPTRVRLTGVGFFDRAHGATGAAPNVIELHPVLKVEWI
jgi:hypothetical protein